MDRVFTSSTISAKLVLTAPPLAYQIYGYGGPNVASRTSGARTVSIIEPLICLIKFDSCGSIKYIDNQGCLWHFAFQSTVPQYGALLAVQRETSSEPGARRLQSITGGRGAGCARVYRRPICGFSTSRSNLSSN